MGLRIVGEVTGSFGTPQARMPEAALVDRAEFGLGFQPDFEIAILGAALSVPNFLSSQGNGLVGGHVFGLGVDSRILQER
ncbi:MAG: hypothetical protein K0R17_110 [Rariglobus sp.]|nr:hypothetical protein [Rariglobus sp.]